MKLHQERQTSFTQMMEIALEIVNNHLSMLLLKLRAIVDVLSSTMALLK